MARSDDDFHHTLDDEWRSMTPSHLSPGREVLPVTIPRFSRERSHHRAVGGPRHAGDRIPTR